MGKTCINVRIKNYRQTPAYKCVCEWRYDLFDSPLQTSLQFETAPPKSPIPSRIDLPPGAVFGMETFKVLSQRERSDIIDGTKAIYAHGEIRYFDTYGKSHITTFRYMYACHEGNEGP